MKLEGFKNWITDRGRSFSNLGVLTQFILILSFGILLAIVVSIFSESFRLWVYSIKDEAFDRRDARVEQSIKLRQERINQLEIQIHNLQAEKETIQAKYDAAIKVMNQEGKNGADLDKRINEQINEIHRERGPLTPVDDDELVKRLREREKAKNVNTRRTK